MLSLLSPAKKLADNFNCEVPVLTSILFEKQTKALMSILKEKTVSDIASLMGLSDKLARLNFERYQDFKLNGSNKQQSLPALLMFKGDVYQSLDAESLTLKQKQFSQEHLLILSGLYGLLRPFDKIQPYRLEMGTKLENKAGRDLYELWQTILTEFLMEQISTHKNKVIINLSSTEYSKAINYKMLSVPFFTVNFKENKDGKLKTIGILAKKARGAMARYICQKNIDEVEKIYDFNLLDYKYNEALSDEKTITFVR